MKFKGSYELNAKVSDVWRNLNEPEILKNCIDGCTDFHEININQFKAKIIIRLGPVNATFNSLINISNIVEQKSYDIEAEGNAGSLGLASGKITVVLKENGEKTSLTYEANSKINGKLAQLGSRLIDGSVRKNTEKFFKNFEHILTTAINKESISLEKKLPKKKFRKVYIFLIFIILLLLIICFRFI